MINERFWNSFQVTGNQATSKKRACIQPISLPMCLAAR